MAPSELELLVADGVIREIEADEATAGVELATARKHVDSAAEVAESDPNGAFQLAYDAVRKAVVAHMRARGFRIGSGPGAHIKTGRYLVTAFAEPSLAAHVGAFEDMRRLRNQSEYDALLLDEPDAHDAIGHAHAIVAAVERDLA